MPTYNPNQNQGGEQYSLYSRLFHQAVGLGLEKQENYEQTEIGEGKVPGGGAIGQPRRDFVSIDKEGISRDDYIKSIVDDYMRKGGGRGKYGRQLGEDAGRWWDEGGQPLYHTMGGSSSNAGGYGGVSDMYQQARAKGTMY